MHGIYSECMHDPSECMHGPGGCIQAIGRACAATKALPGWHHGRLGMSRACVCAARGGRVFSTSQSVHQQERASATHDHGTWRPHGHGPQCAIPKFGGGGARGGGGG